MAILRNAGARGSALVTFFRAARWLTDYRDEIRTSFDPPRSLRELQDAVGVSRPGTEVHHINEEAAAEKAGDPKWLINGDDNLVRIPKRQHRDISDYYQTKSGDFDGLSPREWLEGKSWKERREFGLLTLKKFNVLN